MGKGRGKLPTKIFVYQVIERNGEKFLDVQKNIDDCAAIGERRFVGEYHLVKTGIVSAEVKMDSV